MLRGRPAEQNASENALHFRLNAWTQVSQEFGKHKCQLARVILAHNTTQRSMNQPKRHPTSRKQLQGALLTKRGVTATGSHFSFAGCATHMLSL